jgi:BRCA1-associated protein
MFLTFFHLSILERITKQDLQLNSPLIFGVCREQKETKERDARIADLEDQVRDLMVYIEAQRALETTTGGAEIRDGTILALPANVSPSTKSNGRSLKAGKKKK